MSNQPLTISGQDISRLIHSVRDQRVILDSDLARIYGVETRALNQAVKRNPDRFPEEFVFQLTVDEAAAVRRLRSQTVILKTGRGQHRKYAPFGFTEHGALMAATVLNSPQAVKMSLFIVRAFLKMREELATNAAILRRLAEIDRVLLVHDAALRKVFQKLQPLLAPPPVAPKPEIGFHVREAPLPYRVRKNRSRP